MLLVHFIFCVRSQRLRDEVITIANKLRSNEDQEVEEHRGNGEEEGDEDEEHNLAVDGPTIAVPDDSSDPSVNPMDESSEEESGAYNTLPIPILAEVVYNFVKLWPRSIQVIIAKM